MKKLTRRAFHAMTLAAATCLAGAAEAQQIDLAGKTVTLVINVAPGGATALTAQLAAEAWAKTMAGNPTIVVQPVEGGALSRGIHQVMNSRPDGLTVGWLAWDGSTRILDPVELQIPFDKFGAIAGVGGFHFFMHVDRKLGGGLEKPDDFAAKVKGPITMGGFSAKSSASMRAAGALDMLGIEYRFVSGFAGGAPLAAAIERGEIDSYPATGVDYNQSLKSGIIADGKTMGLYYFSSPNAEGTGLLADPSMPEFEPFDSYYRRVKGEEPSGPIWDMIRFHGRVSDPVNWLVVAPPGTPEAHLAMLRETFVEATAKPEFLDKATSILRGTPKITGYPQIGEIVREVASTDETLKETMRGFLKKMEQ